jgi:hypothetical protein
MIFTVRQIKQLIRESLKDFFDAQDSGDWGKYDSSIGREEKRQPYENYTNYGRYENPCTRFVYEWRRVHLDDMALYQRDLKERYKDFTKFGVAAYQYIQQNTHEVDAVWKSVGKAISDIIEHKNDSGANANEQEKMWQKMKQHVPQLA